MMRAATTLLLLLATAPAFAQHEHHQPPPSSDPERPSPPPHAGLPEPTAPERAAAFPDLGDMDMRGHMDEDPLVATLSFDQLEWRGSDPGAGAAWNLRGWIGGSHDRLWLRSEGERQGGATDGDVELLWGRPRGPWWDLLAGVRHDIGHGPARDWLAVGVQGLAPYKFEVEATAYIGTSGRTALRAEAEYDVLLTNRVVLQPGVEVELHGRDDPARGIGAGLSGAELGLRLRYEVRREFAPYAGYVWSRKFGRTAEFARMAGDEEADRMWVAGVRFWF